MSLKSAMQELEKEGKTPLQVRLALIKQGFQEDEVEREFASKKSKGEEPRLNNLLSTKELLDRIGYGFASPQFVNILFFQSGASLFFIGLMNSLKSVISLIWSSLLQEYNHKHTVSQNTIARASIAFGFSFFIMAFASLAEIPWLFAAGFILGSIGVVTYGDLYRRFVDAMIKHERRSHFLRYSALYGIIIAALALLASGFLIDYFQGSTITIGSMSFRVYGFILSFMITAFAFILGGYILSLLPDKRHQKKYPLSVFFKEHHKAMMQAANHFLKNKYVVFLLLPGVVFGILQVLATSYYGIHLFTTFRSEYFGGFLNIGFLFSIALIVSLFAPVLTKQVEKSTGVTPHLVFGTLLTAIFPLVLAKGAAFVVVLVALVLSVIGNVIVGTAQGLIVHKLMDTQMRQAFFVMQSFLVGLPYMIIAPLGAWYAGFVGLHAFFYVVALSLICVVAPLYLVLVFITNKYHL